jgi:CIC family chloride channel protein
MRRLRWFSTVKKTFASLFAPAEDERYGWSSHIRWPILSIVVGIFAGSGAIFFEVLLKYTLHFVLNLPTGYLEPIKGAELLLIESQASTRTWLFLLIPTLGGLAAGLLVFLLAPEAEGHGTDAMIEAFHHAGGFIRKRVPPIKVLASAITIGSGGSAGKEGPIAQIGAGLGSILASWMRLSARDRRILVLAGAAGGIGAIFHAPLGAALFAPEVLYRETEFEFEAIMPCIVASIVASSVFDQYSGRATLFFPGPVNFEPRELLAYLLFGGVCALVGYVYIKVFYGSRDWFFHPLKIPRIFKPALGGLLLGLIAFLGPPILDGGYGWIQVAMEGKILWKTMLALAFLKIIATSCTISSGGSGGVFGPSVFIGAMLGGAFGFLGHSLAPAWVINPKSFVLVGIGGFFAGVAKVPVASIIMACEMCASYTLLVPLMLVSAICYLFLGKTSLYEKQLVTRLVSPAHLGEFARGLLEKAQVQEAILARKVVTIPEAMPFGELIKVVTDSPESYFPVINDQGKMTGILSINDIREVLFEETLANVIIAKDVATPSVVRTFMDESLQDALDKMALINVNELPVVWEEDPDEIVGMIAKRDIISYYHERSRKWI